MMATGVATVRTILITVFLAALLGCKQTPYGSTDGKKEAEPNANPAPAARSASVVAPQITEAEPDQHCGIGAYPFPRSYQEVLADAPQGPRKPITTLEMKSAIDSDGNITHLRFLRLSSLDSVNKAAFDSLKKQHYKPTIIDGERVPVCTIGWITVDLNK